MTQGRPRRAVLRALAIAAGGAALVGLVSTGVISSRRPSGSPTDGRPPGSATAPSGAGPAAQSPTTVASTHATTPTGEATPPTPTPDPYGVTADPKPATWTASSGSLTATVEVSATSLRVADIARFVLTVEDEAGSMLRVAIDYGDGTPTGVPAPGHIDCAPGTGATGSDGKGATDRARKQVTFEHAYRRAVAVAVTPRLVVRSEGCGRPDRALEATGDITVRAATGAIPTNGPLRPTLAVAQTSRGSATSAGDKAVSVVVTGTDLDGYIQRVEIDWGDGSAPAVETVALGDCRDDPRFWAPSQRTATFDHTYATPGEHAVVARVISSGCAGADTQRGEQRATVTT